MWYLNLVYYVLFHYVCGISCYIVYNHTNELGISLVQNISEIGI